MNLLPDSEVLKAGYRYAFALTMHRQDAEDLLHDAWIRLVTRYRQSPEKPVLFRTIRNLFIDSKRHAKVVDNYVKQHDKSVPTEDNLKKMIDSELLEHHLVCLRPIEQEVLFLSVVEGYTADEIAAMQSTVRGTILSMLSRAKKKIRVSMQNDGDDLEVLRNELVSRNKKVVTIDSKRKKQKEV